jgi:hypothetical protein
MHQPTPLHCEWNREQWNQQWHKKQQKYKMKQHAKEPEWVFESRKCETSVYMTQLQNLNTCIADMFPYQFAHELMW